MKTQAIINLLEKEYTRLETEEKDNVSPLKVYVANSTNTLNNDMKLHLIYDGKKKYCRELMHKIIVNYSLDELEVLTVLANQCKKQFRKNNDRVLIQFKKGTNDYKIMEEWSKHYGK